MSKILAGSGHTGKLYVEDVFSAYTYTGNGGTQTITNGIDLAGKGGMVWTKERGFTGEQMLNDSVRTNINRSLTTNNNYAEVTPSPNNFSSFNSNGYSLINGSGVLEYNYSNRTYVSWSFAQGNKFFKVAQVVVSGSNQTVDLSSLGTVGMVTVKRTDSTSAWYTLHRSNTAGKLCYLNTTAAETTDGSLTLSGTNLTLVQATIGNGTYIVYAWAHDTASTGIIQCGSFTTDANGRLTTPLNLGWESQYIQYRAISTTAPWIVDDTSRGWSQSGQAALSPNSSEAEAAQTNNYWFPTATGADTGTTFGPFGVSSTYIYLAIRRGPMKTPTSGTQVYNAVARTGTSAAATVTGVGFAPDLVIGDGRTGAIAGIDSTWDRLRGTGVGLYIYTTGAEFADTTVITSYDMDGVHLGTGNVLNHNTSTFINYFFRRAPGVFDEVCYTGDGVSDRAISHSLGVVPEMVITKSRSSATNWYVFANGGTTQGQYLLVDQTIAVANLATFWGTTAFSSTAFRVGPYNNNQNTATHVAYLFATLAGVSKVGSYTGNGSSQTINCGFSTGARFILIKRTDSTGDWYVWDSVRGIISANDPHLSLNTTSAEVTTDDSVDPDTSGFIVNQVAATNINVTSATYIYLSFA